MPLGHKRGLFEPSLFDMAWIVLDRTSVLESTGESYDKRHWFLNQALTIRPRNRADIAPGSDTRWFSQLAIRRVWHGTVRRTDWGWRSPGLGASNHERESDGA